MNSPVRSGSRQMATRTASPGRRPTDVDGGGAGVAAGAPPQATAARSTPIPASREIKPRAGSVIHAASSPPGARPP